MQYLANLNQVSEKILNLVTDCSNPSTLLEDLAVTIGKFFQVDACIVFFARKKSPPR